MKLIEDYRIFFVRLLASLLHQLLVLFGIFQIFQTHSSPLYAGLLGLFLFVPSLIVPIFAVQHLKRIESVGKAFLSTQLLYGLGILILLVNTEESLVLWYLAAFLASIARAVRVPFHYSIVKLYPHNSHKMAILNNLSWQVPIVLAPLIISFCHEYLGVIYIKIFMAMVSITVISISFPLSKFTRVIERQKTKSFIEELRGQLKGTWSIWLPAIGDVLVMAFASLPVIVSAIILENQFDSSKYGILISFPMLITILSVVFIAPRVSRFKTSVTLGICFAGMSIGFCFLMFSSHLNALFAGLFFIAIFDGVSIVVRDQLLINNSQNFNVGLLSSINAILISGADELGQTLSGLGVELGGSLLNLSLTVGLALFVSLVCFGFYFRVVGLNRRALVVNIQSKNS